MRLIEVIPISKSLLKEKLSYFTVKPIKLGSIISVPVKKKNIKALVISAKKISSAKTELKRQNYLIKKISGGVTKSVFLKEFIDSVLEFSSSNLIPVSSALFSFLPKILLEEGEKIIKLSNPKNKGYVHEKYIIQITEDDRFVSYRGIIREQIAKNNSVIFIAPTIKLAERAYDKLQKGINEYCFLIHSSLKKSKLQENITKSVNSKKPVVLITTSKFLAIPVQNIGAIILEKEGSSFYKSQNKPFIDFRNFVEIFAKKINVKLFLGDLYLRTETIWRAKEGELVEFLSIKARPVFSATQEIIDMKSKSHTLKGFKIVSGELEKMIKDGLKEKKKIFLFSVRKGLHPLTICGDCGQTVLCQKCSSPVVLHGLNNKNYFLCHKCGRERSAEERCQNCSSWKLVSLGIGTELIEKKLKEHIRDIKVFKIDGDNTPTSQKAEKVLNNFYKEDNSVLLGTEMAINYLKEIDYSAVVSMDSFFSIPDFRINEKIINLTFSLREKTKDRFIIQTRNIKQEVMNFISNGNLVDFYRFEIKQRENFNFPPFSYFIKITISNTKEMVNIEAQKLKEYLTEYNPSVYPAFTSKLKGKSIVNVLIRIKRDDWINADLKEKILALPLRFSVDVNPDNLL